MAERKRPIYDEFHKTVIGIIKKKLELEWANIDKKYEQYAHNPSDHPMYTREWTTFYMTKTIANSDTNMINLIDQWKIHWQQYIKDHLDQDKRCALEHLATCFSDAMNDYNHYQRTNTTTTHMTSLPECSRPTTIRKTISEFPFTRNEQSSQVSHRGTQEPITIETDTDSGNEGHEDIATTSETKMIQVSGSLKDKNQSFGQLVIDTAVMKATRDYLIEANLEVENLSDAQLTIYIKFVYALGHHKKYLNENLFLTP